MPHNPFSNLKFLSRCLYFRNQPVSGFFPKEYNNAQNKFIPFMDRKVCSRIWEVKNLIAKYNILKITYFGNKTITLDLRK